MCAVTNGNYNVVAIVLLVIHACMRCTLHQIALTGRNPDVINES
jgi:hypothetical protein